MTIQYLEIICLDLQTKYPQKFVIESELFLMNRLMRKPHKIFILNWKLCKIVVIIEIQDPMFVWLVIYGKNRELQLNGKPHFVE